MLGIPVLVPKTRILVLSVSEPEYKPRARKKKKDMLPTSLLYAKELNSIGNSNNYLL